MFALNFKMAAEKADMRFQQVRKYAWHLLVLTLLLIIDLNIAAASDQAALYQRIEKLLAKTPLIDGHNDIPWQYQVRAKNHLKQLDLAADLSQLEPAIHTDIARLRRGLLGGQFWSVYIPIREYPGQPGDTQRVLAQIDLVHRLVAHYAEHFELAYTAQDVRRIHRQGRIASLIGIEGGHAIEDSLAVLRMLYLAGARYMTLTHSRSTRWADSATDISRHGGLTAFGEAVVSEMNRMGMLVDLSHVATATMHDALDISLAPVIFSHSSAHRLVPHQRNVPDAVLRRVADHGGVVMMTFFPVYVSDELRIYHTNLQAEQKCLEILHKLDPETIDAKLELWKQVHPAPQATWVQVADHIDHVRQIAGIQSIGLGGDYDGMPLGPIGLEDVSSYPDLFVELLKRGYSEADITAIAGSNILRVMERVEQIATKLQRQRQPSDALLVELDAPKAAMP